MMLLTHAIFGSIIGRILSLNFVLVFFGTIMPDLDPLLGLSHRGFTHSILFLILAISLVSIKDKKYGASIGVGILSHLILDIITVEGIPLFYPFGSNITLGLTTAGDLINNAVIIIISIIALVTIEGITHIQEK